MIRLIRNYDNTYSLIEVTPTEVKELINTRFMFRIKRYLKKRGLNYKYYIKEVNNGCMNI